MMGAVRHFPADPDARSTSYRCSFAACTRDHGNDIVTLKRFIQDFMEWYEEHGDPYPGRDVESELQRLYTDAQRTIEVTGGEVDRA